jgi:hypothetical protein
MVSLSQLITQLAEESPEGTPLCCNTLLGLGNRASVDQALSRLSRRGKLFRICQGIYMKPVTTRFGVRPPEVEKVVPALSELWNEPIVPSGSHSANALGLTTQVPVQPVYLTSGNDREIKLGEQAVELCHVPAWQLFVPNRPVGDAIRAMWWLGESDAVEHFPAVKQKFNAEDIAEMPAPPAKMPTWLAQLVRDLATDA